MSASPAGELDRSSPVPVYYQIEQDLKNRITRSEWSLGEKLPSENELCEQYQVSRLTLRQALSALEQQKIIRRQRGAGTFISSELPSLVTTLNYVMISRSKAGDPATRIHAEVLERKLIPQGPEDICDRLQIGDDTPVVYIKRLYYRGNKPLAISYAFLSSALVPSMETIPLINNSVSQTLEEHYHLYAQRVDDYIEGIHSNPEECTMLQRPLDAPLLQVQAVTYLEDGTPLDTSTTVWAGDSVRFHMKLIREGSRFIVDNTLTKEDDE